MEIIVGILPEENWSSIRMKDSLLQLSLGEVCAPFPVSYGLEGEVQCIEYT